MKKISIFALALFMANLIAFSVSPASYAQTEKKIVSDIKVKGNNIVSTTTIVHSIKIQPGDIFEESALNKELKRLYATGYFSDVFVETETRPEGMVVIFSVVEKPVVSSIEFRGNNRIKDNRLLKKISIKEGMLVDFHTLAKDVSEIRNFYVTQGFSRVTVNYEIETDTETGKSTVIFRIDEGVTVKIKKIEFVGNMNITSNELEKYMATKTAWWFFRKGAFDSDGFEEDMERLRSVYRSKGFLDAKVSGEPVFNEDGKTMTIVITIDEGEEYLIGEISITGNPKFENEEIQQEIYIQPGDSFEYKNIKEDTDRLQQFYYDRGYMNAEIDVSHKFDTRTGRMNVKFLIEANDVVYVGMINVIGNTKTKDKVIRRELRVYPGEKYDGQQLKKSKERIYNLGYFEDVYFDTIPTDDPKVKDLSITVKETKTGELSFGGGFSSIDSFIGFAQIRQKNFDITAFPTFTGGGQDLVIRGEMGSARTNYLLSWTDPWIFDQPYSFGFDIYRNEYDKYGKSGYDYDEKRTGVSLKLGKEITDELSTGLVYNIEEVRISNISDDASQDLKDEEGNNKISRITWNTQYDTRDNRYSPTTGFIIGSSIENAGGFIGGDKDFFKMFGYITYYRPIYEDIIILELKGRSGIIQEYGDTEKVPIYERFFAGGATTIRGYEQRAVGPRDSQDGGLSIGGNGMVIGNAEVIFPVYKNLIKGSVFYDVGNVMPKASDLFTDTDYKQGAGIGVRVKTPIGPMKLDWGYPLSKNHDDKKEGQFYFSVTHGF